MAPVIEIPEDVFRRLAELAQPFVDTKPADVIHRLLDERDAAVRKDGEPSQRAIVQRPKPLEVRVPRERGVSVDISGQIITADSVRDLFDQVLRLLAKNGEVKRVRALIPYKTSSRRYLIADRPVHPNGNPFVVPVEHGGLYMETHKSYRTAVSQLAHFLSKCGLSLRYLG